MTGSPLALLLPLLLLGAPALATTPCWDGTGAPLEGERKETLPKPVLAKGYPGRVVALGAREHARRVAVLTARNPGVTFELDNVGFVRFTGLTRFSCATQAAIDANAGPVVPSAGDVEILKAVIARNDDVIVGEPPSLTIAERGADGVWRISCGVANFPAYESLVAHVGGRPLSDAALFEAVSKLAVLERIRTVTGDSCGPECGAPPSSTTLLGTRPLRRSDVDIQRYLAVFRGAKGLTVRRVAALMVSIPNARLSKQLKWIDAVTAERVDAEAEDIFDPASR